MDERKKGIKTGSKAGPIRSIAFSPIFIPFIYSAFASGC